MRKYAFILLAASFLLSTQTKAQTEQNTLMLGGNASFQAVDNQSLFIFTPNLGVFVKKNFAIGLQATLLNSDGASQWSLGPFARLYFGNNEKGKFFGQGTLSIYGGDGADVTLGGGLTAGYAAFLNQSIALEFAASYFRIGDEGMVVIGAGFQIHFLKNKK